MITGTVSGRHVLVPLVVRAPNGQEGAIEFVLDTGFAGFLTIPTAAVGALLLPFLYRIPARLADGSIIVLHVHEATVIWEGQLRDVEVLATGLEPLLGTSLLDSHEVTIQFADGGIVTIESL